MTVSEAYDPALDLEENEDDGKILGLPPIALSALLGILGAGIAFAIYYYVAAPMAQKNQELKGKIEQAEQTLKTSNEAVRQEQEVKRQLAIAEEKREAIAALFASKESLNTLVFDLEALLERENKDIKEEELKAKILKFAPLPLAENDPANPADDGIIKDGSLGAQANDTLKRYAYTIEIEGSFAQTQSFLRNVELLQSFLLVRELKSDVLPETQQVDIGLQKGKIAVVSSSVPRLKTAFRLEALVPLSVEEVAANTAPPPPEEGQPAEGAAPQ